MHKGVIFLVKPDEDEDPISAVEHFLEPYGEGDVWDWYQIGGRWTGTLTEYKPLEDPDNIEICRVCNGTGLRNDELGKDARLKDPAYTCNGCSGEGKSVKWPTEWKSVDDNCVELSRALPVVKEWVRDLEKETEEAFKKLVDAREKTKAGKAKGEKVWDSSAYHAGIYKDAVYNNFCFDSNVYDITEGVGERIPEDTTGYYAVMVDMHN